MTTYTDRLRSEDWTVEACSHAQATAFIEQHHYARGMSNTAIYSHALFNCLGSIMGVCVWLCPTQRACKTVDPDNWKRVLALSRLAIHPSVPKNACSFTMARSIELIRRDGRFRSLVSFADSAQGHTGHIYRASGWTYCGVTVATPLWVDPLTGAMRSISATRNYTVAEMRERGLIFKGRFVKHKFVRYLDKRMHRRFCEL